MLSFVTPLWLFGLAVLPVIRWLHRGGRHRRAVAVSRLGLWRGAAARSPAAGLRQPPDPAWRRRALLAALLFVALAEPQWPVQREPVTLWVDDSLSMLTREAQGTRLAVGMAQARTLLAGLAHADVEVRGLGDPWQHLGAPSVAATAALAASAGRRPARPPPAALLLREHRHWLLTDGAHAAVFDWPGGTRPDRIIQIAAVTRNVGLERLSARRRLADADEADLLLKVSNGGTVAEVRTIVFTSAAGEVARSTLRLAPAGSMLVSAVVPVSADIRAALQGGDALPEDDEITLDLAPLRKRRVATDPKCPAALVAAVRAHPALALAPGNASDVQAVLDCGSPGPRSAARDLPTLRVRAERTPAPARGAVQWSSAVEVSRRIRLDAVGLRLAARLQPDAAAAVLLAAGDEAVIVSRAGTPRRIETALDFAAMASARDADLPLLMNLLFEQLFGGPLLDALAVTDRGPASSRVAPVPHADGGAGAIASAGASAVAAAQGPRDSRFLHDAARPVLLVALLALLWEVAALGRQWVHLSRYAKAPSE